jgi:glutathione S-transferase
MTEDSMKLYWSAASPYARKCRILIRERGLKGIEEIVIDPFSDPGELIAANPLGKVPLLVRGGGVPLYDSRVICTYLDSLEGGRRLLHAEESKRINVLRAEALADGVMDLSVALSLERRKPEGEKSPSFAVRWRAQLERGLDAMTSELAGFMEFSLADAAFASALGYLDYRQPKIDWRATRKSLDLWFADISERASLLETAPPPR